MCVTWVKQLQQKKEKQKIFSQNYRKTLIWHQFPCKSPRVFRTGPPPRHRRSEGHPTLIHCPKPGSLGSHEGVSSFAVATICWICGKNAARPPALATRNVVLLPALTRTPDRGRIRKKRSKIPKSRKVTRLLYPFNLTTSWRTKNLFKKIIVSTSNFSHHEIIKVHSTPPVPWMRQMRRRSS